VAGPENSIIQGQLQHICLIINYFENSLSKNILLYKILHFSFTKFCSLKIIFKKKVNTFTNNIISVIAAKIRGHIYIENHWLISSFYVTIMMV